MSEPVEERVWIKHYDQGVPANVDFRDVTVVDMFREAVEAYPDRDAVIFLNCRLTYRELGRQVDAFAASLHAMGIRKNSRVAIQLPNLPQTIISAMATLSLGAQPVMTNPLYVPREIIHQWSDANAHVAVTGGWLYETLVKGIRKSVPVEHYVIAHVPDYLRFPLNVLAPLKLKKAGLHVKVPLGGDVYGFKQLVAQGRVAPSHAGPSIDDLALLQYTGGTTGAAKGVMLTHRNLSYQVQQLSAWLPMLEPGKEVMLGSLPYFHVFGFVISMLFALAKGATVVVMPNPRDIPMMAKNVEKHRVSVLPAVPALFNAMNQFPGIDGMDVSSVKVCVSGSAPLPQDVLDRFEGLTGAKISEGFGMTECSPVTHCNPLNGLRKIGSIGIPIPNTDARIVDPEDGVTDLPVGEAGELIVTGPQIMAGYWGRPEATAEAVRDGWMYTGDLAVMDEDGYFRIVGRKKDMILASGYNIYPDEIDRVLASHPAVFEACTIGVPDERRGETVKSYIVLHPDTTCSHEEILAHCKAELAAYKVPKLVEFRDSLPKSSMMKLLRRALRDEEIAKGGSAGGSGTGSA